MKFKATIDEMRDRPQKDAATSGLKENREGLADLVGDAKKDLDAPQKRQPFRRGTLYLT